jgi:hypothetical protein
MANARVLQKGDVLFFGGSRWLYGGDGLILPYPSSLDGRMRRRGRPLSPGHLHHTRGVKRAKGVPISGLPPQPTIGL